MTSYRYNKTIMYELAKKYSGYPLPQKKSDDVYFEKWKDGARLYFVPQNSFSKVVVKCEPFKGKMYLTVRCGEDNLDKVYKLQEEDLTKIIPDKEARSAFMQFGEKWNQYDERIFNNCMEQIFN